MDAAGKARIGVPSLIANPIKRVKAASKPEAILGQCSLACRPGRPKSEGIPLMGGQNNTRPPAIRSGAPWGETRFGTMKPTGCSHGDVSLFLNVLKAPLEVNLAILGCGVNIFGMTLTL